jgi:hypothetical protein
MRLVGIQSFWALLDFGDNEMGQYTFRLRMSGVQVTGQSFANDEAACCEAQTVARELSHNGDSARPEYLELIDERGRIVYLEPLA